MENWAIEWLLGMFYLKNLAHKVLFDRNIPLAEKQNSSKFTAAIQTCMCSISKITTSLTLSRNTETANIEGKNSGLDLCIGWS